MTRNGIGVVALVLAVGLCGCGRHGREAQETALLCYVGGTMRPAMEELAARYQRQTGHAVQLDFADSGQLLVKIEQAGRGDLLVVHDPFPAGAQRKGLAQRAWTPAVLDPVIVVPKGNPKAIHGFRDLAKPGLRVILSHEQYSTAGHIVARMAAKAGICQALDSNVVSRTRGGGEAANAVALGTADAAVVWKAVGVARADKLDIVPLEEGVRLLQGVDAVTSATYGVIEMDCVHVGMLTLTCSTQRETAGAFAEFVCAPENREVWLRNGFSPVPPGRELPATLVAASDRTLLVHCAAGMRVPVEAMAQAFEKRTGIRVNLTFEGSNRLLGQIKLTRRGDLYVAGDAEYVDMAAKDGLVARRATLGYFIPVLLVAKGNPRQVRALADLTAPNTRIGQGDEKSAAVGRIMPRLLALNGVDAAAWQSNVVMTTPTVNELGLGIKLGTLDATVVWDAIAAKYTNAADIVAIPRDRNVCPVVEAAVLTTATQPEAAADFLAFMASADGRQILKTSGYTVDKP